MQAKPYSVALPLLGAFFLNGCAEQPPMHYDVPRLLDCNLEEAEGILGKASPYSPDENLFWGGGAFWANPDNDYYLSIMYRSKNEPPLSIILRPNPNKDLPDLETTLAAGNLSSDNQHYSVTPMYSMVDCYEVIVLPK